MRLALRYVPDHATAEDVAQETWLQVLGGLGRFQFKSSLRTWILSILKNRARFSMTLSAVIQMQLVIFSVLVTYISLQLFARNGLALFISLASGLILAGIGFMRSAHSLARRSGPTRLNFASSLPSTDVPWPMSRIRS